MLQNLTEYNNAGDVHIILRCFCLMCVPLQWYNNDSRRDACRVLVGRPEGRRPLRRTRSRWEDNIKIHLSEV